VSFGPYDVHQSSGSVTSYDGQYTVFMVAFEHQVSLKSFRKNRARFLEALETRWTFHPFHHREADETRPFNPASCFTPTVLDNFFGSSERRDGESLVSFVERKLEFDGDGGYPETLLFTLDNTRSQCIGAPLALEMPAGENELFFIDWVDLWLFSDGSGQLAFKARLSSERPIDITRTSMFHRSLRDIKVGTKIRLHHTDSDFDFWQDLFFGQWLGFEMDDHENLVGSDLLITTARSAWKNAWDIIDRNQRYCKLMICTHATGVDADKALQWGRAIADPQIHFSAEDIELASQGQRNRTLATNQDAIIAGYATVRDMILFELATLSEEGASLAWNGKKNWQYCPEYIRRFVDQNFIEVWDQWAGIVMRDSCVFTSFDSSMPIMYQAEERYYALYMFVYHQRFMLDVLAGEAINFDMIDTTRGHTVMDKFQRFRNQYWFREPTVDFMGVEVFSQMKKGLDIDGVYEVVKAEVEDISSHLQEKWERGTKMLFAVLVFLIAPFQSVWNEQIWPFFQHDPLIRLPVVLICIGMVLLVVFWQRKKLMSFWVKVRRVIGMLGNK